MIGTWLHKAASRVSGATGRPRPVPAATDKSEVEDHQRRPALTVTVYTRAQCGCCRKALDVLRPFQARYRFEVDLIDVDTDPALAEAHGRFVPVIAVNGKVRFRGQVNPVLLERLLQAQTREPL
ncbi:MAG TPA: glutaredoxin family protein [Isosphaeraceae bacterium]|nr:glutaredoxin family protein [Isosphaeraceae bacterium]